jgi:A/G-specific adenine glycosylase
MVGKAYKDFLRAFPNTRVLAKASVQEVRKIVGRLGLAYRAERFVKIAKLVETKYGGKFPCKSDEILELPGVGPYIANSLLCFAFDLPVLIVDSNVMRIMNRCFGITSEMAVRKLLGESLGRVSARELNLALIDLGALVCTPYRPKHAKCPIEKLCEKRAITPQRWKFLRKVKSSKLREQ